MWYTPVYAWVSTAGQTVDNQIRELEAVAKRLGWEVVDRFVDQGISGAEGRDGHLTLDRMLKNVVRGELDVVDGRADKNALLCRKAHAVARVTRRWTL